MLVVVWATMQSYMAMSTCWPRPVFRRVSRASMIPMAVQTPGTESPILSPTIWGGLPGWPVISIHPPIP